MGERKEGRQEEKKIGRGKEEIKAGGRKEIPLPIKHPFLL